MTDGLIERLVDRFLGPRSWCVVDDCMTPGLRHDNIYAIEAIQPQPARSEEREAVARIIGGSAFTVDPPNFRDSETKHEQRQSAYALADRILAALAKPAGSAPPASGAVGQEPVAWRDAVAAAFHAGAMSVHEYWRDNPGEAPGGDPEFGEAADDYAASVPAPNAGEVERMRVAELERALLMMREFASRNATQWQLGCGHHHPLWVHVAELMPDDQRLSDAEYRFIHPENTDALAALSQANPQAEGRDDA